MRTEQEIKNMRDFYKKEALIYVYNERIAKYKKDIEKDKKNIAIQEKEMADCINTRDSLINGE